MCGIVGFITRPGSSPDLAAAMHRPLQALTPRGPDDEGVWMDPMAGVALGARRLAVTDLSDAAQQPMVSPDGRWHVVFNGHIAGHQALRKKFLSDQSFASVSDTATLASLISRMGFAEALPLLEGQFALAAWDAYTETLHLARDRFGVRPLVYGSTAQGFGFASTARAWSLLPGADLRLDPRAKDLFSSFGWVPPPMTILGQARSVLPGQRLAVRAQGHVEQEMWWSEPAAVELAADQSVDADALEAIIDASIREQLEAERGVGLLLSGGIDSSFIASSPAVREAALPAFVATFPDAERFDESVHAQKVADALGLPLTKISMTDDRIQEAASRLGSAYDEPFADASALPTLALTKEVAQHCTVAISGDGGDELFAGYRRYGQMRKLARIHDTLPSSLTRSLCRAALLMPKTWWQKASRWIPTVQQSSGVVERARNLASRQIENVNEVYPYLHCHWPDPGLVMASDFKSSPLNQETEARRLLNAPISRWQYLDMLHLKIHIYPY